MPQRFIPAIGLLVGAAVILFAILTQRDNPDLLRFEVEGNRAYGYGFTDDRSEGVVRKLLRDHPEVDTLVLRDMSGTRNVISNQRLARSIREAGLDTHIESDSFIASGAVDLFIAGVRRTAECGARVGVHAWGGVGYDAQNALYDNMRDFQRAFHRDMGVEAGFYDFTKRAAPSKGLHIMSPEELNSWGVVTEPLTCE